MVDIGGYRSAIRGMGLSDAVADWWLGLNRPGVILGPDVDGPVTGHLGGVPLLPSGVAWPEPLTFIASVDCAALPRDGLDSTFPTAGNLLFFAGLDIDGSACRVIHVPPGTPVVPVTGRDPQASASAGAAPRSLKRQELRARAGLTFQGTEHGYPGQIEVEHATDERTLTALAELATPCTERFIYEVDGPPHFITEETVESLAELTAIPGDDGAVFQVCGRPYAIQFDPEDARKPEGSWILLAQLFLWLVDAPDLFGDIAWWLIRREDLAAGRFDRVEIETSLGG